MDNGLPIMVFNMSAPENIRRVLRGEHVGTRITVEGGQREER
jgi:uridylate kinase